MIFNNIHVEYSVHLCSPFSNNRIVYWFTFPIPLYLNYNVPILSKFRVRYLWPASVFASICFVPGILFQYNLNWGLIYKHPKHKNITSVCGSCLEEHHKPTTSQIFVCENPTTTVKHMQYLRQAVDKTHNTAIIGGTAINGFINIAAHYVYIVFKFLLHRHTILVSHGILHSIFGLNNQQYIFCYAVSTRHNHPQELILVLLGAIFWYTGRHGHLSYSIFEIL